MEPCPPAAPARCLSLPVVCKLQPSLPAERPAGTCRVRMCANRLCCSAAVHPQLLPGGPSGLPNCTLLLAPKLGHLVERGAAPTPLAHPSPRRPAPCRSRATSSPPCATPTCTAPRCSARSAACCCTARPAQVGAARPATCAAAAAAAAVNERRMGAAAAAAHKSSCLARVKGMAAVLTPLQARRCWPRRWPGSATPASSC